MLSSTYSLLFTFILAVTESAHATAPTNIQGETSNEKNGRQLNQIISVTSQHKRTLEDKNETEAVNITSIAEQCLIGFNQLQFDFNDFDRYPEYFRNESTITLAQAGVYKGVEDIEEYVKFVSIYSPYLSESVPPYNGTLPEIRSVDVDGVCEFSFAGRANYVWNPETTAYASESTNAFLARITYDSVNNYIPKANVYYNVGLLNFFFGTMLESHKTRRFLCEQVINGSCNFNIDKCEEELEALDTFNDGSYIDGNSYGCRTLHGVFAETNPTNHCPHVSFEPMLDPNGKIKCQESDLIQPEDLFEEADFTMFEDFERSIGIDPEVGYFETCDKACADAKQQESGTHLLFGGKSRFSLSAVLLILTFVFV